MNILCMKSVYIHFYFHVCSTMCAQCAQCVPCHAKPCRAFHHFEPLFLFVFCLVSVYYNNVVVESLFSGFYCIYGMLLSLILRGFRLSNVILSNTIKWNGHGWSYTYICLYKERASMCRGWLTERLALSSFYLLNMYGCKCHSTLNQCVRSKTFSTICCLTNLSIKVNSFRNNISVLLNKFECTQ